MLTSKIITLPPELQSEIRSYLSKADSISLSLCSKRLYTANSFRIQSRFPANSFWAMLSSEHDDVKKQLLAQWDTRIQLLPRLRRWIERVTGDAAIRSVPEEDYDLSVYHVWWEICVGCASYKIEKDGWKEGVEFETVIDQSPAFEDWLAPQWQGVERHIYDGMFCQSCCREWDGLNISWDVGVFAS